jgi:hypothetical protein
MPVTRAIHPGASDASYNVIGRFPVWVVASLGQTVVHRGAPLSKRRPVIRYGPPRPGIDLEFAAPPGEFDFIARPTLCLPRFFSSLSAWPYSRKRLIAAIVGPGAFSISNLSAPAWIDSIASLRLRQVLVIVRHQGRRVGRADGAENLQRRESVVGRIDQLFRAEVLCRPVRQCHSF